MTDLEIIGTKFISWLTTNREADLAHQQFLDYVLNTDFDKPNPPNKQYLSEITELSKYSSDLSANSLELYTQLLERADIYLTKQITDIKD